VIAKLVIAVKNIEKKNLFLTSWFFENINKKKILFVLRIRISTWYDPKTHLKFGSIIISHTFWFSWRFLKGFLIWFFFFCNFWKFLSVSWGFNESFLWYFKVINSCFLESSNHLTESSSQVAERSRFFFSIFLCFLRVF
jgi:hypothetical protein